MRIMPRLASFHDIDLITALALGKRFGFHKPEEAIIFAVQAEDVPSPEEGCRPSVERVIPDLVDEIAGMPHKRFYRKLSPRGAENA
jgi:hypothetical protein